MRSISINSILFLFCVYFLGCHEADASCDEKEQKFIKVSQDGLAEVNPFKKTTVTSRILCSFDCADHVLCLSFVYLKQTTTENCLLSTDPDGGSSSENSETYISTTKLPSCDLQVCNHNKCQRGSKCIACSPDNYKCECPPWASGPLCQNLNPVFNQSLIPWKQGDGHNIKTVDIAFNVAWSTTSINNIYINLNGEWVYIGGKLIQISVGENGVWGISDVGGAIFTRAGITESNPSGTGWSLDLSGALTQITSGGPGILWGFTAGWAYLYYKSNGAWVFSGSQYKWVSCGKFGCWALTTQGVAFFRVGVTGSNPGGDSWVSTGGSFKQLDTGVRGEVYAVDNAGQLYTREGVTENLPEGIKWSKFGNMLFSHVSVGDKTVVATTPGDGHYYTLSMP